MKKTVKKDKGVTAEKATKKEDVVSSEKAVAKKEAPKTAGKKSATIKKFQSHENDTGSTEVQVAVLSEKINMLSKHIKAHKKDVDSRMGLLRMISQRRSLLSYLEKRNPERYKKLIASLGLRK